MDGGNERCVVEHLEAMNLGRVFEVIRVQHVPFSILECQIHDVPTATHAPDLNGEHARRRRIEQRTDTRVEHRDEGLLPGALRQPWVCRELDLVVRRIGRTGA